MKRQVITSWKCSWTMLTLKGFCSCMFSHMSCELIWTSKPPSTSIPGATIRFFAYLIINFEEEYLDQQIELWLYVWPIQFIFIFFPYLYVFGNEPLDESFLYTPYYNQGNCIYAFFYAHFVSSVVMHLAHWVVRAYICILYHLYLG